MAQTRQPIRKWQAGPHPENKERTDKRTYEERKTFPPKLDIITAVLAPNLQHSIGPAKSELGRCYAPSSAFCQIFPLVCPSKEIVVPQRELCPGCTRTIYLGRSPAGFKSLIGRHMVGYKCSNRMENIVSVLAKQSRTNAIRLPEISMFAKEASFLFVLTLVADRWV